MFLLQHALEAVTHFRLQVEAVSESFVGVAVRLDFVEERARLRFTEIVFASLDEYQRRKASFLGMAIFFMGRGKVAVRLSVFVLNQKRFSLMP